MRTPDETRTALELEHRRARKNRVRVFEHHVTLLLCLECYEPGPAGMRPKPRRMALGHRDREAAKAKAEELAAAFRNGETRKTPDRTLVTLFDIYEREVTPSKATTTQRHDRRAAQLFLQAFGRDRLAKTLNRRDWDAFIRERRSGRLRPPGAEALKAVGELRWLLAVLNWATRSDDGRGHLLLERNPLAGLKLPKEENPRRPMLRDEEYEKMLAAAPGIHPLLAPLLILAHETGHRVGSVRQLRWGDVNLESVVVTWRAEFDKIGFEHETPLSPAATVELERLRRSRPVIGDGWVFSCTEEA